ncbi:hypothetical protein JQ604_33345 [Bradyrhizobium jicamae]|uniref:hypothetical protein n=1 Tax=Bradyrhizobium jicamae TaxID=280332 RepID=UPI001BACDE1E|nr:hypothetical protein [Bradyrhizobium jicamae]MBR0757093.1 hypothetical protein [Bradyrhizobium jicamae]
MAVTEADSGVLSKSSFWMGVAAYLVPTFAIAYVWHLVLFAPTYDALGIYRPDPIIPFGFVSMVIQGIIFSWAYPRLFPARGSATFRPGVAYGLALAVLSWSFTTLAVAAKSIMSSVPLYVLLETGFTLLQFAIVGPLIALAYRN